MRLPYPLIPLSLVLSATLSATAHSQMATASHPLVSNPPISKSQVSQSPDSQSPLSQSQVSQSQVSRSQVSQTPISKAPAVRSLIVSNPSLAGPTRTNPDPSSPPPQRVRDPRFGLTFDLPAGWNLSRRDGDLSTFGLDARSSLNATQMRAVADIAFNPFPLSTFSGALFYFSATPRSTPLECSNQATAPAPRKVNTVALDGVAFSHGYDEHGAVCTEARDEVYTALHNGACYRFDLVINTFCGGEVSGSRDMTPAELDSVRHRLESILTTVRLGKSQDVLHPRSEHASTD